MRFAAPAIIERNMEQGRNGLREGQGFYDYGGMDVEAYKLRRLGELCARLEIMGLLPRFDGARAAGQTPLRPDPEGRCAPAGGIHGASASSTRNANRTRASLG